MTAFLLSDFLPGCLIDQVERSEQGVTVWAHSNLAEASCPACQRTSSSVHSTYARSPKDRPLGEWAVKLRLQVRRFRCRNPACARQIFAERWPDVLAVYAQRTTRLSKVLRAVGYALSGEGGVRLLEQMQIQTSARTLLRIVRSDPTPVPTHVRVLGVDDWAIRKGRTYGTILVDLERRRPIDLLADRSAATLVAWLQSHPEVEIISRDRSTEYARGASEGAPTAQQVADRWHLLQNLRQMVERLVQRLYPQLQQLPVHSHENGRGEAETLVIRTRLRLTIKDKAASAASRAHSQALYRRVQHLRRTGHNIRQIAQQLAMSRTTVRKYFYAEAFPERAKRQVTSSILDPYLPYLALRHQDGCKKAKQLWRELKAKGYPGAYVQVRRWLQQHRQRLALPMSAPERADGRPPQPAQHTQPVGLPSYKQLTWLLLQEPAQLLAVDNDVLKRVCQDDNIAQVYPLLQQFRTMVRQHCTALLDPWLAACAMSHIPDLETFGQGIRHDYAAVRAALETHWSNGQTEGQVNRLKLLKRQMYGRANFDLLRLRVLHPT